jgi:diguanylate cyclase (GGDEF)-like protein
VNTSVDRDGAERELALVQERTLAARAQLGELERAIAAAAANESMRIVEVNEQLVVAAVRAQEEAKCAARRLQELTRSAEHDVLTGLPNRVLLMDRLEHAVRVARRRKERFALMFLDLNNFKQVNDTLGHATGDDVLRHAARAIESAVRDEDTVSRHGGDEFLVLLSEIDERGDARVVAEKIIATLGVPTRLGEHVLRLTASIGISVYPDDGENADELIDRADAAMYVAKRHGLGGFAFHGQPHAGAGVADPASLAALRPPFSRYESALAEHELRHEQLREANTQLVIAAIEAQALQAAAELAHRRQTEFLALLAHELRDPLSPIRTAAAILTRADAEDLPKIQATIERQVAHMTRLVGDLLEIGRVSTGKLRIERERVDLIAIIDAAIETCRHALDVRLQNFTTHLPPGSLEMTGDAVRLTQVLSNLLLNASKYTPEGGAIDLTVDATAEDFTITIVDNGIGVSAGALPGVFEPFMQDAHAVGFNRNGLGIGLTVVRELVNAHGGNVQLASAGIGLGCTSVVRLPRQFSPPPSDPAAIA